MCVYILLVVESIELALKVLLLWAAAKLTRREVKRKERDSMLDPVALVFTRCLFQELILG